MGVDLVEVLCVAVVTLSLPALSTSDPLYVMSAPNLLRVGTPEKVFVEAQDYSGDDFNVILTVKDFPKQTRMIDTKTVTLSAANNYLALAEINIAHLGDLGVEDADEKIYVYLQATFKEFTLEKIVLLSFQSGYIFVQTDKTIYTPASTVRYRVFSLSPALKPVVSGISVEVMTPDQITILREILYSNKGVKSGEIKLPDIASFGIWKVVTRFQNAPQKNYTTQFEVKTYVLPSYEVTLIPKAPFFYIDDDDLTVDILARYFYGRDVTGTALVMFGVFTKDNMKKSLPESLKRVEIREGKGVAMLTKEQIIKTFPEINQLVGSSLYLKVTVFTDKGNEMVEAEKQDIKIVTSPYTINFKATPKYFKPGMPFDLSVYVSNPDNLPVKGVAIEVVTAADGTVQATTTENGMAKVTVNTLDKENTLSITVRTKVPELPESRQAQLNMTASAYRTTGDSKNYLHIGVPSTELTIGEQIKISLFVGKSPGIKNEQDFTYLIMNKGQLVHADRFKRKGQAVVTLSFPVTGDMLPSFRIVAYYHVGSSEVVSDSVWVDVKDTCMGKLKVELTDPKKGYAPHKPFSLSITGDPEARVGLVAVDKGVYVLNNKHRLTQRKIWDVVEKLDIGCTAGSGKDSMGVFYDAGLVFVSNTAGGTDSRTVHTCSPPVTRRRRFASSVDMRSAIVQQYEDESLQRCCGDGLHEDLVGRSCEVRAEYVSEGKDCRQAFLRCCQELSQLKQRAKDSPKAEAHLFLARSGADDDAYMSSEDIVSRTQFPESWLWEDVTLPKCPADNKHCSTTTTKKTSYMKDSVTTWEIMAISLSENHGMCIADPLELAVTKMFFIDLRLPYSAKRGEQLEIKAILHNNGMNTIQVRVELMEAEHVCSMASKRGSYRTMVEIEGMTSHDVAFVIIPMELGTHTIEVKAAVQDVLYGDGVKKDLRVVPEGVLTKVKVNSIALNPNLHGGQQRSEIKFEHLRRQVPNTPASTHIRVQGPELRDIIVAPISGESMGSLFKIPYGNGEQNIVTMAMSVIATHYLDLTNQWDKVGLYERKVAVKYIKIGYQQQRSFHKRDGSYAADKKTPSSTWLTAFVVRVLSMADGIISIEEDMVCSALQWLVLKTQRADGSFKESAPVSTVEDSTGKVYGKDSDASLTAFVLIAIQDGKRICPGMIKRLEDSMGKASEYLHLRIHTLTSSYAVAIVSYALADSNKHHKDILLRHRLDGGPVWPVPGGHQYTLEATAYALMALLRMREFKLASDLVLWLHKQRGIQGGYGSTQSTVIVYQAVAEYRRSIKTVHEINLDVNIDVSGRSKPIKWTFNKGNSFVSRSDKLQIDQELTVTAKGNGEATLSVMTLYYAPPSDQDKACNNFKLNLTLEKQAKASHDGASASYILKIDVMYMSEDSDADLSVLSIGKLTGFEVDIHDLNRMSSAKERYIQRFEVDNILSQGGSLLIYLNKVSHNRPDTIAFRIHKMVDVGLLQPAAVTVYKYYDNESRCVKFYHPEKLGGSLHRLCHDDICRCAEENCSVQKKEGNKNERDFEACDAGMDYVYKVTVQNTNLTTSTDVYFMRVTQVVKEGSDFGVLGAIRVFVAHPSCRKGLDLNIGKSYLLIGHRKDLTRVDRSVQYVLGHRTWVEYWPTEAESKEKYTSLQKFAQDLSEWGCRN